MARAASVWTNTVTSDWDAADLVRTDKFLAQVLQNIEHIGQTHNHDVATANRGGPLVLNEPEEILWRIGAVG